MALFYPAPDTDLTVNCRGRCQGCRDVGLARIVELKLGVKVSDRHVLRPREGSLRVSATKSGLGDQTIADARRINRALWARPRPTASAANATPLGAPPGDFPTVVRIATDDKNQK